MCDVCVKYLTDEHASRHGQPGAGGEVGGDHDAQAGLREGQFVGVEDEELVHHDDWRRLLTVSLACEKVVCFESSEQTQSSRDNKITPTSSDLC